MALDIGRNVFVVGMRRSESRIVRMREVVVPVQTLVPSVHLVAVGGDQTGVEVQFLSHQKPEPAREQDFSFGNAGVRAVRPGPDGGTIDTGSVEEIGQEAAIGGERRERGLAHESIGGLEP